MNPIIEINDHAARLLNNILTQARTYKTYDSAIKYLKNEQTQIARNGSSNGPSEIDRAILHLADAVYGEAIYQISKEAREQPIKEV